MGQLLSIETGYGCNSRCGFCPQVAWRQTPGVEVDLTGEAIRAKIDWGAENGYDQIGFSGGEVTIRPDALDLLRHARDRGYRRIGLTTNGRMLAYPAFAKGLVEAGVSAVNFSIHGHTAALHDLLTHSPGSFEQAMRGVDMLRGAAARAGRKIDLMSMTLACPANAAHFGDLVGMLGARGFRLHMLQPFIANEDTIEVADRFMLGYPEIEKMLREAIEVARRHDGRVKLYNIPPCLLRDVEDRVDPQHYAFDVFSRHDEDAADEANIVPWGFYRVPECTGCKDAWICPGFRAEYYPQDALLEESFASLDASAPARWLAGTELLSAESLGRYIEGTRARGAERVAVTTGGAHRLSRRLYATAAEAGADEIVFVAHFQDPRAEDPRIRERGNDARLLAALEQAKPVAEKRGLELSLSYGLQDLLAPRAADTLTRLTAAGLTRHRVGISYAHHDVDATTTETRPSEWREALQRFDALREKLGFDASFVATPAPEGASEPRELRAALAERMPTEDGASLLPRTRLAGPDYYWITWSVPHWAMIPCRPPERDAAA